MERREYRVVLIDGDYAHLQRLDEPEDELFLVARTLLPPEIDEGSELVYEMLQFRMKDE